MNNSLFYTDAKNEGRIEGREEGIKGAVNIMLEMNCSESDIISRLIETFNLTEEEAKTHYDEYASSHVLA